ncbi:MAG: tetratricopeptide repeat protein [Bacteroidota bacterium]
MKIFLTLFISLACCLTLTAQSKNAEKAFNKGLDYFQEQEYDKALDHFKAVIWADPDHEAAHDFLAQIYTEQGKNSFAIKHLKRVLAINSDREDSWIDLAKAYAANDQEDKAVSTLEKAANLNPAFSNVKVEMDNLLNPPAINEPEIVEEAVAYETLELEIQPPMSEEIVSIDDESAILLEESSKVSSSMTRPIVVPVFKAEEEEKVMEPIKKEEVMAPAPAPELAKKEKKARKMKAGQVETEEMSTAILNELLPALEQPESVEEVVMGEVEPEIEEKIVEEVEKHNVTVKSALEVPIAVEEEVVEEILEEETPALTTPVFKEEVVDIPVETKEEMAEDITEEVFEEAVISAPVFKEEVVEKPAEIKEEVVEVKEAVVAETKVVEEKAIEEVAEEVVEEEAVVPSFSSTPRIPGIRMPSAVDHVLQLQESKKSKKKNKKNN